MLPEDYERVRNLFANSSNEKEKLLMLRSEAKRYIATLSGYAELMSKRIKEQDAPQIPDDYGHWCEIIVTESHKLNDLLDASVGIERDES